MALSRVPASRTAENAGQVDRGALERAGTDPPSDSTLHILERAQAGDPQAATILIERALPPVRRWAHGRLPRYARGASDTEDVIQDVFLRTLRGIKRFQHRTVGGLQAYLRQAVVNRIRDLIRGSKRREIDAGTRREARDWKPSPLEAAIMGEQLDRFLEALGTLRPADRQVIVWRIELGYTADEIATKLGKSKAAAGMTVTRAMARLAKALKLKMPPD
jgi:RNA polymerase sigma factor (sigma-70 family)